MIDLIAINKNRSKKDLPKIESVVLYAKDGEKFFNAIHGDEGSVSNGGKATDL